MFNTTVQSIINESAQIQWRFYCFLIVENWDGDLDDLNEERLSEYAHRLDELFMNDTEHISIHDLAYAVCQKGFDASADETYDCALMVRE